LIEVVITEQQVIILKILRLQNSVLYLISEIKLKKRIVQFLLNQGQSTFNEIVNYTNRAPSTISWHLNKLKNAELITSNMHDSKPHPYKIRNKNRVAKIISKY
jgi:DNA-binding transcriptional ArsR family regulator